MAVLKCGLPTLDHTEYTITWWQEKYLSTYQHTVMRCLTTRIHS